MNQMSDSISFAYYAWVDHAFDAKLEKKDVEVLQGIQLPFVLLSIQSLHLYVYSHITIAYFCYCETIPNISQSIPRTKVGCTLRQEINWHVCGYLYPGIMCHLCDFNSTSKDKVDKGQLCAVCFWQFWAVLGWYMYIQPQYHEQQRNDKHWKCQYPWGCWQSKGSTMDHKMW